MNYMVIDHTNKLVRSFFTYKEASCFLQYCQRYDWTIIPCSSTPKQKAAVHFCEEILGIEFEGNIESKQECSQFLTEYLDLAKQFYTELKCEYENF